MNGAHDPGPGPSRRPRHRRGDGAVVAALAGVIALVALAVIAVGTIDAGRGPSLASPPLPGPPGGAAPPTADLPAARSPVPRMPVPAPPAPPAPVPTPDALGVDVAAGECIRFVVATDRQAQVSSVPCSDPAASHIVVDRVRNRTDCPADIDVAYYETRLSVETLALCLDVNWMIGRCFDITEGPAATTPVACAAQPDRRVRQVEAILAGTVSLAPCAESGIVYSQRQFVVCVRTVL